MAKGKDGKGSKDLTPVVDPARREELARLLTQVQELLATGDAGKGVQALLATVPPGDTAWDVALIAALGKIPQPAVARALHNHFSFCTDKTRRKALKKALHHFQAQGVVIPADVLKPAGSSLVRPLAAEPVTGYLSPMDGTGSRIIILHGSRERLGFSALTALVNDVRGIEDCFAATVNKKGFQELLAHAEENARGQLAVAAPAYCRHLLEEAYALAPESEGALHYRAVRERLHQQPELQEAPDLEELLPALEAGAANAYVTEAQELVLDEVIGAWMPGADELEPWVPQMLEVLNSPLVLSEDQQKARFEDVIQQATRALYPQEQRLRLSRRFKETAYYYDRLGQADKARRAQAVGEDLQRQRSELEGENPFLTALVSYPLSVLVEQSAGKPAAADKSSLLAPSSSSLLTLG